MVKISFNVRNMTKEQWSKMLGIMTYNGEPAHYALATRFSFFISQDESPRYNMEQLEVSNALEHLEQIANGFVNENEALLYVNFSTDTQIGDFEVRVIAQNIIKYGRESVWCQYIISAT